MSRSEALAATVRARWRHPREVDVWLQRFRGFWVQRLDALSTELARGRRERHTTHAAEAATSTPSNRDNGNGNGNDEEST